VWISEINAARDSARRYFHRRKNAKAGRLGGGESELYLRRGASLNIPALTSDSPISFRGTTIEKVRQHPVPQSPLSRAREEVLRNIHASQRGLVPQELVPEMGPRFGVEESGSQQKEEETSSWKKTCARTQDDSTTRGTDGPNGSSSTRDAEKSSNRRSRHSEVAARLREDQIWSVVPGGPHLTTNPRLGQAEDHATMPQRPQVDAISSHGGHDASSATTSTRALEANKKTGITGKRRADGRHFPWPRQRGRTVAHGHEVTKGISGISRERQGEFKSFNVLQKSQIRGGDIEKVQDAPPPVPRTASGLRKVLPDSVRRGKESALEKELPYFNGKPASQIEGTRLQCRLEFYSEVR